MYLLQWIAPASINFSATKWILQFFHGIFFWLGLFSVVVFSEKLYYIFGAKLHSTKVNYVPFPLLRFSVLIMCCVYSKMWKSLSFCRLRSTETKTNDSKNGCIWIAGWQTQPLHYSTNFHLEAWHARRGYTVSHSDAFQSLDSLAHTGLNKEIRPAFRKDSAFCRAFNWIK